MTKSNLFKAYMSAMKNVGSIHQCPGHKSDV